MRTAIDLPDELRRRAQAMARETRRTSRETNSGLKNRLSRMSPSTASTVPDACLAQPARNRAAHLVTLDRGLAAPGPTGISA